MSKSAAISALLMLEFFAVPFSTQAAETAYVSEAPISFTNANDVTLFKETLAKALESGADGATMSWRNSQTNSNGEITPFFTREVGGSLCRRARIVNRANGRQGDGAFEWCRQEDGEWKIVNAPTN